MKTESIRNSVFARWSFIRNWKPTIILLCDELDKCNSRPEIELGLLRDEIEKLKKQLETAELGNKKLWQFITINQRLDQSPEMGSIRKLLKK